MLGDVPVLCGVDPAFAGLHDYSDTGDGRSYMDTAHVAYPFHQRGPACRRETTIVMPKEVGVATVVHELGHVLDDRLGFSVDLPALTEYGGTNRYEAFAVAFTAWVWGPCDRDEEAGRQWSILAASPGPALFEWLAGVNGR